MKSARAKNETNNQYRGLHLTMVDADSGLQFEFQMHTEASFFAKQLEHPRYEESALRVPRRTRSRPRTI